ncbi:MAG: ribonuclease H-like domain-containing protein [Candidatus Acidiferrales bacterium]
MTPSLDERLARLAALRPNPGSAPGHRHAEEERANASSLPAEAGALAELLGAQIERNRYGEHLVVRQWHSSPEACETDAKALNLLLPAKKGTNGAAVRAASDPDQWLFLDTETTGLAGGTGTYAFLVGIAWWDAGGLQVEQFFMRDHSEEHAVLLALAERIAQRNVLVTFNGKCFDWPLLETRYRMTRAIRTPALAAHLDMLHPARQLWRLRLNSVRLTDLERHVLSQDAPLAWSRRDDLDSSLIPQMYFDYLRGGQPHSLVGVFRHNAMDLRALAALAGRILSLLGEAGAPAAPNSPEQALDLYGLSRLLGRRGETSRARAACEGAIAGELPVGFARMARRELAQMAKRQRDYSRATELWEQLARSRSATTPEVAIEAYEQLAIYYEHHAREPKRAAELTQAAMEELRKASCAQNAHLDFDRSRRIQSRLDRRLARLARKAHSAGLSFNIPTT